MGIRSAAFDFGMKCPAQQPQINPFQQPPFTFLVDSFTGVVLTAFLGLGIGLGILEKLELAFSLAVAVSLLFASCRLIVWGSLILAVAISAKVSDE